MRNKTKNTLILLGVLYMFYFIGLFNLFAYAQEVNVAIGGKVYTFGEDDQYDYTESEEDSSSSTSYGTFHITGEARSDGQKAAFPSYAVDGSTVTLTYSYNDDLLNADVESWHLVDDNSKKVAGVTLNNNIKKGALILQTSKDGQSWITDVKQTNVFADTPVQTDSFYSANSIQLANGCYYRLIVAYEVAKKVGEKQVLFIKTDVFEYLKKAEVYEFYLHSSRQTNNDNVKSKTLGTVVNTGKDNGYSGSNALEIDDPHYGWQIGIFL